LNLLIKLRKLVKNTLDILFEIYKIGYMYKKLSSENCKFAIFIKFIVKNHQNMRNYKFKTIKLEQFFRGSNKI